MMDLLHQLVARSEATQQVMLEMQGQVGLIGDLSARLKSLENKQALGGIQPPSQAAAASPQLFQPSVGALDQGRRDRLQALAGRGPSRVKDLGATSQPVAAPLPPVQGGTIGDDEEDEADPLHQLDAPTGVLEQLLVSQTALLSKLAASKVAQHDPLAMLVSPQESEEGVKHTGVKGIAARQMLIDSFKKHPDKVYKIFRERLSLARRRPSVSSLESRDLWLHMQETVPLGTHRTLTYMGFQAAAMFEAAERGEIDRLKMLVALQAIFVEQAAYDSGSLRIAHLLTCLEDPPFAQTESHRVAKVDFAHSQLSDPRWLAAQLGYLKRCGISDGKDQQIHQRSSQFLCGRRQSKCGRPQAQGEVEAKTKRPSRAAGRRMKPPANSNRASASAAGVEQKKETVSLPPYISSKSFGIDLFKVLFDCRTPLGNFVKQSLILHMTEDDHHSSKDLWPCPIPASIPAPRSLLKGRRRSRLRLRVVVREHLRVFVASCNWLSLGRPKKVIAEEWASLPLSSCQSRMLEHVELSLRSWYRQSSGLCSDLQRSEQKFSTLHETIAELSSACSVLRTSFDPYSRRNDREDQDEAEVIESSGNPVICKPSSSSTAVDLDPNRLKFSHTPQFQASKFITDPLLKAGFLNPRHFRSPKEVWPSVRPARVTCDREKLLQLFKKWDDVNSFRIIDASQSEAKYRCGLFAVYKNAERDRQILNPIPENSRTFGIADATHNLSHGTLLSNIELGPHEDLVIAATDLEDFYHCFRVSPEHSARNHIHGVFDGSVFRDWNCWDPSLADKKVVGCFSTLAMGTNYAVEIAQHTHTTLLRRAGCLLPSQQVKYRHPFPRGSVYQMLCIDDYAILQKVPKRLSLSQETGNREDLKLLESAEKAYTAEGLRSSKKKTVKNSKKSVVLGGEVDGIRGTVSAPGLRVLALCKLTLAVAKLGHATKHLIQSILGCWIFVLLFRRPLLALLSSIFHEGDSFNTHQVFALSTGARHELLMLCIWGPLAFSNIRAQTLDKIFCSDASLEGAGVCQAQVSKSFSRNLARLSEQKGFYTRVDTSTLGFYNAQHGEGIWDDVSIPKNLQEGFLWDFVEVFRGSGHLSKAHQDAGFVVHPGFEVKDGTHGDILIGATFLAAVGLVARRVVRAIHVAPVCTTFGTLRRPRVRSKQQPFGYNPSEEATAEGNLFAVRAAFLLFLCHFYQIVGTGEQPGGSVMFRLDIYQRLLEIGFFSVKFPFCSWGAPFQKNSWWLSNNPRHKDLEACCSCGYRGRHFRVQGTFDHFRLTDFESRCRPDIKAVFGRRPALGEQVASFSAAYPLPLCKAIADRNAEFFPEKFSDNCSPEFRPSSSSPHWVAEVGRGLEWKKLLQFRFRKLNHININETLAFRSLVKHVAKSHPSSRFVALLDSKVVIGSSSKGRSSSKQLNFYLSTLLPHIIGSDLYPFLIHIASKENPSDDISRFVELRWGTDPPRWLKLLLKGNPEMFDQVVEADKLKWPFSGWSRLVRLLVCSLGNR